MIAGVILALVFPIAGASNFALPVACCGPAIGKTTADIIIVPPVVVPPVVIPPVVVVPPEVVVPPVVVPPVVVPPEVVVPPVVVVPPEVVVPPVVVVPPEVAVPPEVVAPTVIAAPLVEVATATPQIQSFVGSALVSSAVAGMNFTVVGTGVRMPPIQLTQAPPVQPAPFSTTEAQGLAVAPEILPVQRAPVVAVPVEKPPNIPVGARRPPKLDRN